MNIEGTYTLQAQPEEVWRYLMDQQVLLHSIPGIEHLEQTGKDTYTIAMNFKQTPLIGNYQGQITISEQQYPYHYRLSVEGEGRRGSISGVGSIHLNVRDTTTIIAYKGELALGKTGTLLPPALAKGAAKLLIQQFFTALADQLDSQRRAQITGTEESLGTITVKKPGGNIVIVPSTQVQEDAVKTSVFHSIVHSLGLGEGNPARETRWEKRLRRISVVSMLLLLVWIGTRLPGRR